ncbi:hypothetical protein BDK51DRAFT_46280 [Blyttiomyces helicus]|uniref:Uncharacterized protein n=1 Tax=Blyttiomyces helicus TaxID=388810 RepID=A0A4P9W0Z8_9FUNG|nr:hypothetical protein BDK51DRAFT_46280 [Blyttiomyces helicus]|eukprot:RKO85841.1 hypothetical protein BDK51DRAFT_46280 [Blyttiomyces helicus]
MPFHSVVYYCLISLPAYCTQYVARKTTLETPSTSSILDMILWVLAYTGDDRIKADIPDLRGSAMSEKDRFEYEADKRREKDDASRLETAEVRGLERGRELEAKRFAVQLIKLGCMKFSDVLKCAGVAEDVLRGWYTEEGISTPE